MRRASIYSCYTDFLSNIYLRGKSFKCESPLTALCFVTRCRQPAALRLPAAVPAHLHAPVALLPVPHPAVPVRPLLPPAHRGRAAVQRRRASFLHVDNVLVADARDQLALCAVRQSTAIPLPRYNSRRDAERHVIGTPFVHFCSLSTFLARPFEPCRRCRPCTALIKRSPVCAHVTDLS